MGFGAITLKHTIGLGELHILMGFIAGVGWAIIEAIRWKPKEQK